MIHNLRIIEIELFSYCNRICGWCPNALIDRRSKIEYLDLNILKKLLLELKQNNYNGVFSFSRYNEPFSQFEYFNNCLKLIKSYFPNNTLVTNTNGDYLTRQIIDNTLIDELTVMDYDCNGKEWCLNRLQSWGIVDIVEYNNYYIGKINNKTILYYWNWPLQANFSDRGGILSKFSMTVREKPCFEPLYFVGINYDGTISPCCNIRNDITMHKPIIMGDLKKSNLFKILSSKKYKNFQKYTAKPNAYKKDSPCYYCNNSGGRYTKEKGGIQYE